MRNTWILLSLLASAAVPPRSPALRGAVATLTGIHGMVEVRPDGAEGWARVTDTRSLRDGDRIRVGKGGQAVLCQEQSSRRVLREGELVMVSAGKGWLERGRPALAPARQRALSDLLDSAAKSSRSRETLVRGGNPHQEIVRSPRYETVLDARPTFVWKAEESDGRGKVQLYRDDRLIWSKQGAPSPLAYPREAPPLKPGRYQWQVYVRLASGRLEMDVAEFTVPDVAGAARIQRELAALRASAPEAREPDLPLISFYIQHKLYTPAEAAPRQAMAAALEDHTQRGLTLFEALKDQKGMASALSGIGLVHDHQGNYSQAREYYRKSLALWEALGDRGGAAEVRNNMGLILFSQGDYAESLAYHQQSLTEFEAVAEKIGDPITVSHASIGIGALHSLQGRPTQAIAAFRKGIDGIETVRSRVGGSEEQQQRFLEQQISAYPFMVQLLLGQHQAPAALAYAERAKARVLQDVLQQGRVNVTRAMTTGEQEQERTLKNQLVSLNTQLSRERLRPQPDETRLADLNTQLRTTRSSYRAWS